MLPARFDEPYWALLLVMLMVAVPRSVSAQSAPARLAFPPSSAPRPLVPAPAARVGAVTSPVPTPAPKFASSRVLLRFLLPKEVLSIAVMDAFRRVIGRCNRSCDLWLPRGDYVVEIREGDDETSDQEIELRQSTTISLTPSDKGTAAFGLVLGIVGPFAGSVGMVLTVFGRALNSALLAPGLIVATAGSAAATGGFILYARHRKPQLDEVPLATDAAASPTLRVDASPLVGGVAVAATLTL